MIFGALISCREKGKKIGKNIINMCLLFGFGKVTMDIVHIIFKTLRILAEGFGALPSFAAYIVSKRGRSEAAEGGDDKLEAAQDAMEELKEQLGAEKEKAQKLGEKVEALEKKELKEQKIGKNILIFGFVYAVGWYWYSALGTS